MIKDKELELRINNLYKLSYENFLFFELKLSNIYI